MDYDENVWTVMVNNFTNIIKTNHYTSYKVIEHKTTAYYIALEFGLY
jgi:hypothetical protein